MAIKNKGGRPSRAAGEKLRRIGASIRPAAFESLELLARQRRTSVSQVIEQLALAAGQEAEVNGTSLFAIANQIANLENGPYENLLRIVLTPPDLRSALESYTVEVLDAIGDYSKITNEEAQLLDAVIQEFLPTYGKASIAAEAWREACKAWKDGKTTFEIKGDVYSRRAYQLWRDGKGAPTISMSYKDMLKPLNKRTGTASSSYEIPNSRPVLHKPTKKK